MQHLRSNGINGLIDFTNCLERKLRLIDNIWDMNLLPGHSPTISTVQILFALAQPVQMAYENDHPWQQGDFVWYFIPRDFLNKGFG